MWLIKHSLDCTSSVLNSQRRAVKILVGLNFYSFEFTWQLPYNVFKLSSFLNCQTALHLRFYEIFCLWSFLWLIHTWHFHIPIGQISPTATMWQVLIYSFDQGFSVWFMPDTFAFLCLTFFTATINQILRDIDCFLKYLQSKF